MFSHGMQFPLPKKIRKKIVRYDIESGKVYKSQQPEEGYWMCMENFKEYPHQHVSKFKGFLSLLTL